MCVPFVEVDIKGYVEYYRKGFQSIVLYEKSKAANVNKQMNPAI